MRLVLQLVGFCSVVPTDKSIHFW